MADLHQDPIQPKSSPASIAVFAVKDHQLELCAWKDLERPKKDWEGKTAEVKFVEDPEVPIFVILFKDRI